MLYLYNTSAKDISGIDVDMVFTDPPFEMRGNDVMSIIEQYNFNHLVMICTMRQALEIKYEEHDLQFCHDFVFETITPKKSKSYQTPHMLHANVLYFRRSGVKSAFDRRRVQRHDHYSDEGNYYYPSIFNAPRSGVLYKYGKNQNAINDLLMAFDIKSVLDPFAGEGSTGIAALECGIEAHLIEIDKIPFAAMRERISILTREIEVHNEQHR